MNFLGAEWIWLYIGAGLMLAEILTPGFVMFFFGLSAATVGLFIMVLPESFNPGLKWQLALFSLFSLVYLVTLRRYVKSVFFGDTADGESLDDGVTGRIGEITSATAHDMPGRVQIGDAEWDAVSVSPLAAGVKVKVISRSNLTLTVEAAG